MGSRSTDEKPLAGPNPSGILGTPMEFGLHVFSPTDLSPTTPGNSPSLGRTLAGFFVVGIGPRSDHQSPGWRRLWGADSLLCFAGIRHLDGKSHWFKKTG